MVMVNKRAVIRERPFQRFLRLGYNLVLIKALEPIVFCIGTSKRAGDEHPASFNRREI